MKHFLQIALVLSALVGLPAFAKDEQAVTVTAVSHYTDVNRFTVNVPASSTQITPTTSNTTCSDPAGTRFVQCNTTTTPGQSIESPGYSQQRAIYRFQELVTYNGQTYKLERTARWAWSNTDEMNDGQQYQATINVKKHEMTIMGQHGGNQGKWEKLKFKILDISAYGLAQPITNTTTQIDTHFVGHLTSTMDLSTFAGGKPGSVRCTYTYGGFHGTTATFTRDLDEQCPAAMSAPSTNDWASQNGTVRQ